MVGYAEVTHDAIGGTFEECPGSHNLVAGFVCQLVTHQCAPLVYTCDANNLAVETTDGQTFSCSPYRCHAGQCRSFPCSSVDDCAPPHVCNFSHECVVP